MLTQRLSLTNQDARKTSVSQLHVLGSVAETADGRIYRYARVGAADLAAGKLNVAATVDANLTNKTVAATVAAGESNVVLDAAGAVVANAYKDGFFTINDATGEGISYAVAGHAVLSGSGELSVSLKEPLVVGLTVDVSEASLTKNPWADVVISVTDQLDLPVGVANNTIGDTEFGWLQTGGVASVLADEAITAGIAVTTGTGVAGAVEAVDAAGEPQVGIALAAAVDTEYREVFLTLD